MQYSLTLPRRARRILVTPRWPTTSRSVASRSEAFTSACSGRPIAISRIGVTPRAAGPLSPERLLALAGHVPMVEMQFGDFITCGFNQIVNNLAKTHYRWGARLPLVLRLPVGGGMGAAGVLERV